MGEELLFQELADKNWNRFASLNVKQIVTTSPHCYDTFVNCYPEEMGNEIEIRHYTQFVLALIKQGKLPFQRKIGKKVSYQDPCYLGRHNDIYDDPREILKNIPGTELVEMKRSKEDCLCCGGGGGRMWADFSEEVARLADIRVREAAEVGAEILVTACPFCLINMEDAIKTNGLEGSLEAKDLAELILDAV
jgi:Fe-S oxidoreductase